jgi:acyl carrier protein
MSTPLTDIARTELCQWLCAHLAVELRVPGGRIDPDEPMVNYGLDSLTAAAVLVAVEQRVGFDVDPNALWDHPTATEFTAHLAGRTSGV